MKIGFGPMLWIKNNYGENFHRMMDELSLLNYDGFEMFFPFISSCYPKQKKKVYRYNENHIMTIDHLKELLKIHKLEIATTYQNIFFNDREIRIDDAKERCLYLSELGCENFLVDCPLEKSAWYEDPGFKFEYSHDLIKMIANALNVLGEFTKKNGMMLSWHLHWGTIFEEKQAFDWLMELSDPDYVGFCCDVGQLALCNYDVVETVKQYVRRIKYVHFKDVTFAGRSKGELWPGGLVAPNNDGAYGIDSIGRWVELGRGVVDFPKISEILLNAGYDGWISDDFDYTGYPVFLAAKACKEYINKALNIWGEKDLKCGNNKTCITSN